MTVHIHTRLPGVLVLAVLALCAEAAATGYQPAIVGVSGIDRVPPPTAAHDPGAGSAHRGGAQEKRGTRRQKGDPVVTTIDADGLTRELEQRRGSIVVLNVWATWCVPCVEEFPDLLELHRRYADRGVELVLVSADVQSAVTRSVIPFLRKHGVRFTSFHKRAGDDQRFIDTVHPDWGGPIPVTVIYDRSGKAVVLLDGKHSLEEFERALAPLL